MRKIVKDERNSDKYVPRGMTTEVSCIVHQSEITRMLLYNKNYILSFLRFVDRTYWYDRCK